jgi:alpha-L-arabinofuranosidase
MSCSRRTPSATLTIRAGEPGPKISRHLTGTSPSISAAASRDAQGLVHLSLLNLDPKVAATVEARIEGPAFRSVSGRVLTAPAMDAHNTFAAPDRVQPTAFTGASLQGPVLKVALPPRSVVVLALSS